MRFRALLLLLGLVASSSVYGDSAAEVAPIPFEEFTRIAAKRNVSIDAPALKAIVGFVDGLETPPPAIADVVEQLRSETHAASLKALLPLITHPNAQVVCAALAKHRDPVVRFVTNGVLAGSGDSEAAKRVYGVIHDESIPAIDKRIIRTWCDGVGIRAANDKAEDILAHMKAAMSNEPKLKKGDVVPGFTAVTLAGRKIASKELQGKVIVLHFWATSCGPCMANMPQDISSLAKYNSDDVEILFVSLDDDEKAYRAAVDQYKMPFHNVQQPRGWGDDLVRSFGVNRMPFDIVIGRDGTVFSNSIHDIDAALRAKAAPPAEAR